jgi:hypothetical protein
VSCVSTPTPEKTSSSRLSAAAAAEVARLQVAWIMKWDKVEGEQLPSFEEHLADFYDFDADTILFDDFDPLRRVFRTAREYGEAFWPTFQSFRAAEHGIEESPEAVVVGDLAVTRMVFIAILDNGRDPVIANRCINSQVWRRTDALGWRISRDHTSVEGIDVDEARRLVAASRDA